MLTVKLRNKFNILFSIFALLVVVQGCGKETIGDMVSRQRDRDRETANVVAKDYDVIKGVYQGETSSSDLFLIIDSGRVSKDGTSVPQPTLVGSMLVSPRISVSGNRRFQNSFPFSDGTYDRASKDFSFTIEKDAKPSQVHCKAMRKNEFNCTWYLRTSNIAIVFKQTANDTSSFVGFNSLSGDTDGNASTNSLIGRYEGQNANYNVIAEFEGGVVNNSTSQIPDVTILGHFVFAPRASSRLGVLPGPGDTHIDFAVKSGAYDLLTDSISLTIDTESNVVVNCKILPKWDLHCKWYGLGYEEFTLHRRVRR